MITLLTCKNREGPERTGYVLWLMYPYRPIDYFIKKEKFYSLYYNDGSLFFSLQKSLLLYKKSSTFPMLGFKFLVKFSFPNIIGLLTLMFYWKSYFKISILRFYYFYFDYKSKLKKKRRHKKIPLFLVTYNLYINNSNKGSFSRFTNWHFR